MHYHKTALNVLVQGKKLWRTQHPTHAYYSTIHELDAGEQRWSDDNGEMLRCMQEEGDIVVMPSQFGHATLNVEPSVGFAFEFSYDATPQPLQVLWTLWMLKYFRLFVYNFYCSASMMLGGYTRKNVLRPGGALVRTARVAA